MIFKPIAPWWLLVILFLPIITFTVWRLWAARKFSTRAGWLRRLIVAILLLVIALRPSFPGGSAPQAMTNFDVYFVVDTTSSMSAEDYNGTQPRLEGVKQDIIDLSKHMTGARYSLITFSSATYIEMPLTTDLAALNSISSVLQQEITFYSKGSTISQPVDILKIELEKIKKSRPERQVIVYFMSDGEQTSAENIASFKPLASFLSGGAVLGYGTSAGGRMKENSGYIESANEQYIKDNTDYSVYPTPDAISKIDEKALGLIANQLGTVYIHRTQPGDIDSIVKQVDLAKLTTEKRNVNTYWDIYWVVAGMLSLIVIYDAWTLRTMFKDIKKKRGGNG